MTDQWEYMVEIVFPDGDRVPEWMGALFKDPRVVRHHPAAVVPALNEWGKMGWELVQLMPVQLGEKYRVATATHTAMSMGTATFDSSSTALMAVFRRLVPEGGTFVDALIAASAPKASAEMASAAAAMRAKGPLPQWFVICKTCGTATDLRQKCSSCGEPDPGV